MKKILNNIKMTLNEWKQSIKKKIPKWMGSSWQFLACLLICATIVKGATWLIPLLESHNVILGILVGRWVWNLVETGIKKLRRR